MGKTQMEPHAGEREKQIFSSSHHLPGLSLTIALHQSEREKIALLL